MSIINDVAQWFAGGSRGYMTLVHCMSHDTLWIAITVALDLAVAAGYLVIAFHWGKNERLLPRSPAKTALGNMKNIFVFCGLCGYIFVPIKMFWPAWRLYDLFMAALVYFTWRYAWNAKHLRVVYHELGRSKQLAEDLEKSRAESRRKSFFLNALSHDLRTPLNGLLLQANLAELHLKDGVGLPAVNEALREIKACTRATSELLDGLMEYARVDWADDQNTVIPFKLDELLEQIASRFSAPINEKGLTLRVGAAHSVRIHSDRLKLDRILSNLLSNAIKFTPAGVICIEPHRTGSGMEIHVIDSGIGIDPELRERLFEEFFQGQNHERDPRKGFGLGLAIARRLARQLGGDIQVDRGDGTGSRFTIVLPGVVLAADGSGDAVGPTKGQSIVVSAKHTGVTS